MTIARRRFLQIASLALGAPALTTRVWAQTYPARPVRTIVPYPAGGGADTIARVITQKLSQRLGHQFYVENIPPASGNVGVGQAARAPADGYTIVVVTTGFVINPSLFANIPYDPVKDFAPITLAATSPHALVVHPSVPAKTVSELVALVKASPGKFTYASPGLGQSGQLAAELFKQTLGLDILHVPFNGAAPSIAATVGGHTSMIFVSLPSLATQIKQGLLRPLAVTSAERVRAFPDIPTMGESGVPNQESAFIVGVLAPAGTPADIVDLLNREIARAVNEKDVKDRLTGMSFEPVANSPQAFAAQIKEDVAKWAKVIRDAKTQKK